MGGIISPARRPAWRKIGRETWKKSSQINVKKATSSGAALVIFVSLGSNEKHVIERFPVRVENEMTRDCRSVARHLSVEIVEAIRYGESPLSGGTFGVPDSDEPLRHNWWGAPETFLATMERMYVDGYCALAAKTSVRSLNAISFRTFESPS
jgi:hypothetical protein